MTGLGAYAFRLKPGRRVFVSAAAILLTGLIWGWAGPAWSDQGKDLLDFAQYLHRQGENYRAVTEAKRFIFFFPNDSRRAEADFLIARCSLEAGRVEEAHDAFRRVADQRQNLELAAEAWLGIGRCLEMAKPDEALDYYAHLADEVELTGGLARDLKNIGLYRRGWMLMNRGRWMEARDAFSALDQDHPLFLSARQLEKVAGKGEELPQFSPETAGWLSTICPGAGQVYVGRYTDAALAFLFNAAFLGATYEAYRSRSWVLLGLVGLMEIGWYSGNIYNAVNGAHIQNRAAREAFLEGPRRIHGWRLEYSPTNRALVR